MIFIVVFIITFFASIFALPIVLGGLTVVNFYPTVNEGR